MCAALASRVLFWLFFIHSGLIADDSRERTEVNRKLHTSFIKKLFREKSLLKQSKRSKDV